MLIVREKNIELYKLFNLKQESHTTSQELRSKRPTYKTVQYQNGPVPNWPQSRKAHIKTAHFYVKIEG